MRQTLSRGVFVAAAATGILSLYGNPAFADTDSTAVTKDSGGLLSGNIVQVPIEVPVNVCGNSISVIEVIGHAYGNLCVNKSYGDDGYGKKEDTPPAPPAVRKTPPPADKATPPPTRISETHRPKTPPTRTSDEKPPATQPGKPSEKPAEKPAGEPPQLAETGSETSSEALAAASAASAVLIAGGALMYRRGRAASYR
ncbi:chaplin family protein [Streptomyces sp. NPDC002838]|uniref:chaplin n=1 Tax=Streptomyces sp. NPDC002838 TaxID=3154436 RepID=UPI0033246961